jgi:hypothetical protein
MQCPHETRNVYVLIGKSEENTWKTWAQITFVSGYMQSGELHEPGTP